MRDRNEALSGGWKHHHEVCLKWGRWGPILPRANFGFPGSLGLIFNNAGGRRAIGHKTQVTEAWK